MHSLPDYPDYNSILFPHDVNDGFKKKRKSSYIENKKLSSPPNKISKPLNLGKMMICQPLNQISKQNNVSKGHSEVNKPDFRFTFGPGGAKKSPKSPKNDEISPKKKSDSGAKKMFSKSSKKKKNGFESEDKNKANFETNKLIMEGDKITISPFGNFDDFEIDELDGLNSSPENGKIETEDTTDQWGVEIHEFGNYEFGEEKELQSEDYELFNG